MLSGALIFFITTFAVLIPAGLMAFGFCALAKFEKTPGPIATAIFVVLGFSVMMFGGVSDLISFHPKSYQIGAGAGFLSAIGTMPLLMKK